MSTAARIDELRIKFADNPRRYFAPLANELRKAGNLSEAIALCREFLPRQPEHMSGYIVFGQALHESGEWAEARAVFEQALALDPENLKALRYLGDIARLEGDPASARRWYERVLEADPRNDDIAEQLAALTMVPAVPTPPRAVLPVPPVGSAVPFDGALVAADVGAVDAPLPAPVALQLQTPFGASTAVTSSSAVRDDLPLLDLDALEAAGVREASPSTSLGEPVADTWDDAPPPDTGVSTAESGTFDVEVSVPAVISEAPTDDPFGFSELVPAAEAFEEGLLAPEWPDTTALIERMDAPRAPTPPVVPVPPSAVEAFGMEPGDSVHIPLDDSWDAPMDEPVAELPDEPLPELPRIAEASETGALAWSVPAPETAPVAAVADDMVAVTEDVPLAVVAAPETPVTAPVLDDTAFDDAMDQEPSMLPALQNDVVAEPDQVDDAEGVSDESSATAFVTETMGELLVAQGFTSRAVTVYEELVRRRPYDPVLASRLSELQDRLSADQAPLVPRMSTPAWTPPLEAQAPSDSGAEGSRLTARDRFSRLAARRVPRRTPPRASVAVSAEGFESLFSGEASRSDDQAARALADAFAPIDLESDAGAGVPFDVSMLSGPGRAETPARSATPLVSEAVSETAADPFSFDRFFPDPATAAPSTRATPTQTPVAPVPTPTSGADIPPATVSDDLAQFSAWLKGLGNV